MLNYFLEDDIIGLQGFERSHLSDTYFKWLNDPVVNEYTFRRYFPYSQFEIDEYFKMINQSTNHVQFAIYFKNDNIHVGNIGINDINWQCRYAEVGVLIGEKKYWGKGIAPRSFKLIQNYAFKTLGLNRLEMGSYNTNAVKAFEKAGWHKEGILRKKFYHNGEFIDEIRMSILSTDL